MKYVPAPLWVYLIAIGLTLGLSSAAWPDGAQAGVGFCKSQIVRDYERPLRGMPSDRIPSKKNLSFAPAGVSLVSLNFGKTVLQGSPIGYEMEVERSIRSDGRLRQPIPLHWRIQLRLWRAGPQGTALQLVASKDQRVGVVRWPDLQFFVRGEPGVYRFDMSIKRGDGSLLKTYYRYLRVLPKRAAVRIAVNQMEFQPGDTAIGRIQNIGTLPAFLVSAPYLKIDQFINGEWRAMTTKTDESLTVGPERVLLGGRSGACKRFVIPQDAAGARYRFGALVEVSFGGELRKRLVTRFFSVD
jgi:hypothetical protein